MSFHDFIEYHKTLLNANNSVYRFVSTRKKHAYRILLNGIHNTHPRLRNFCTKMVPTPGNNDGAFSDGMEIIQHISYASNGLALACLDFHYSSTPPSRRRKRGWYPTMAGLFSRSYAPSSLSRRILRRPTVVWLGLGLKYVFTQPAAVQSKVMEANIVSPGVKKWKIIDIFPSYATGNPTIIARN